ncbi:hypothetical protein HNQ91_004997 [Filimonas zeae]|uniref:Uncharacterized protein n=1 Tax=Filimonas zeae TaxID=1737353 RepID=A0A917J2L1_9BACT|nr:hypothetical protein [Filimonas zeae]MDR6341920.1 hypothetical protein [Filimonas zeae]GGH79816.1 hypothetical protein GCM10011379_49760 [Filimonas zeae]
MKPFTLCIEFEATSTHTWQPRHQVCYVQVNLPDGRYCYLTVASVEYLDAPPQQQHPRLPDIFVHALSRECIETAVGDLLEIDNLHNRLNPAPRTFAFGSAHSA